MDTLRWILLIVGVLVIAGLFGYYKWQERQSARPRRKTPRTVKRAAREDRDVEAALEDMDDFVLGDDAEEGLDLEPDLNAMDMEAGDETVSPSRPVSGHQEPEDDGDWTVGPVRVRQVAEPESARRAAPAAERQDWQPSRPVTDADDDEFEADDQEPVDDLFAEYPEEDVEPRPRQRSRRDDDDAWNLGPVRIPRPAWGREPDNAEESQPEDDEAAAMNAVTETVGEKIVVLHVHAGEGLCFTAQAVSEALDATGLRFGQHGIFHRHVETRRGQEPMFSVASMVKPGTLNPDEPETLETPGLALFMQLPGPFDGLSAFEQMLETARRLADQLDGQLLDGTRCDLTNQAVEHIREELREYRRLAHLAARRHHA